MTRDGVAGHAPLWQLSATEAARRMAVGELSPVALMDATLAQADRVDPFLTVLTQSMARSAREAALRAEEELNEGRSTGPLHGVPITVKDDVALKDVPMRQGSVAVPAMTPTVDSIAVRRVKAAGAIVIGKTTLPEFAHKVLTDNAVDGVTRNPWALGRTPGGSSGGAAAGLASGVAPLAIGTDADGSVRCPASCTGTVGLKATLGRIPNETAADGFGSFVFIGPMARRVADVRLLLSVMQGPCGADPYAQPRLFVPRRRGIPGLRVLWVEQFGRYATDPEVAALCRQALEPLVTHGAVLEAARPSCFDGLFPTYQVLATSDHAARYGAVADLDPGFLTRSMHRSIERGRRWSAVDLVRAQARRSTLFRAVQDLLGTTDIIATPTLTAPPPDVHAEGSIASEAFGTWAAPLYPFNMTGHPAVSVPAGFTASGLPVGLQLVGG